mmetsp:Transcript_13460/g.19012  ORF Transcript_13460/g.19012 Transcript_13460/m.19012 type:complete len:757 (+) Transcript_13460:75-2345(+)
MASKPAFDPLIHLVEDKKGAEQKNPGKEQEATKYSGSDSNQIQQGSSPSGAVETDDEALARQLQEQFFEEERNNRQGSNEGRNSIADAEYARMIQESSNESQGTTTDEEFARMIQEEEDAARAEAEVSNINTGITGINIEEQERAFRDLSRNTSQSDGVSFNEVIDVPQECDDLEIARRMQELEEMGMGRLNSKRTVLTPDESLYQNHNSSERSGMSIDGATLAQLTPVDTQSQNENNSQDLSTTDKFEANHASNPAAGIQSENPPGVNLAEPPGIDIPVPNGDTVSKKKKKRVGGMILNTLLGKGSGDHPRPSPLATLKKPLGIPTPAAPTNIPPPTRRGGPLPHSVSVSQHVPVPDSPSVQHKNKKAIRLRPEPSTCTACGKPATSFLVALGKKYHQDCFKCMACHEKIDSHGAFAYIKEGEKEIPLHRTCYAELYGVKCTVCKESIPAGPDGKVSFVKHPFFDQEQMCPKHASNPGRRCTGCHRFEPDGMPFADLGDSNRCVCFSCCRSVVVDYNDAKPLWNRVINFFENKLGLPIWKGMSDVPILIVGYDALNDQLRNAGGAHGLSSQIMTRGLCLTEHQSGRRLKLSRLKFDKQNQSFEACDVEEQGFTFFQVPDADKCNPDASVTAILCLSGLPRDLTASVLAHEATHAWIKLHPRFDICRPIPAVVEEGVAQLIAMLFLNDGLEEASSDTYNDKGPSDAKLRQYFKFSIETDDHEIYGEGYRQAAKAYANIGIDALLSHVVLYQNFPMT